MAKMNFNSTVAARTRAAIQILGTPDLFTKYEELGGLQRDLEAIRDAGLEAEALFSCLSRKFSCLLTHLTI